MPPRANFDHYVAQHYAKLFTDSTGTAYVADITQRTVAPYADFSQILGRSNWSFDQSVEDGFSRIENDVAGALRRLREDPAAVRGIAPATWTALRDFICMHAARAVGVHDALNQSNAQFQSEMRRTAPRIAPAEFNPESISMPRVERMESLQHGIMIGDLMSTVLSDKGCVAVTAPAGFSFVLGDNPFAKLTSQEHFYMRGALPSPTTYFWFPLNPKLGLFFGQDMGNLITDGRIESMRASKQLLYALNRAEVFVATQHIIASERQVANALKSFPNVGDRRNTVTALDWAPFIINQNSAVAAIKEEVIDNIRTTLA